MFACVPFFIAIGTRNAMRYKKAYPYSSYANGQLTINDNQLIYNFWMVGRHEPAAYSSKRAVYHPEDMFSYVIYSNDCQNIKVDDCNICHILGNGHITVPEWLQELDPAAKKEIEKRGQDFSFILDFNEVEYIKTELANWLQYTHS